MLVLTPFVLSQKASAETLRDYQHLNPTEFTQLQKEFIAKEAGLSEKEAVEFFKLYFEYQDKRRDNNQQINALMKKMGGDITENEYGKILDDIYDLRKINCKLEFDYYQAYIKVISSKKISKVMKAESEFRREIIRGINRGKSGRRSNRGCRN